MISAAHKLLGYLDSTSSSYLYWLYWPKIVLYSSLDNSTKSTVFYFEPGVWALYPSSSSLASRLPSGLPESRFGQWIRFIFVAFQVSGLWGLHLRYVAKLISYSYYWMNGGAHDPRTMYAPVSGWPLFERVDQPSFSLLLMWTEQDILLTWIRHSLGSHF